MEETRSFSVGDQVRVLKKKGVFSKGSDMFSRQIYTIEEIDKLSFKIKNSKREILKQRLRPSLAEPIKSSYRTVMMVSSPEQGHTKTVGAFPLS
jgi:hypothetical protein